MHRLCSTLLPVCAATISLFAFAACESGADRRAMEEARKSVPPMAASETFFTGQISAQLTLGSSLGEPGPGKGPGGKGGRTGGRMGGGHRGMGGGGYRSGAEGMSGEAGSDLGEPRMSESTEDLRPRYVDSPMPPAMLRLRLENTSAAQVVVEITDLDSELGNFATRPDKFTLEPNAVGEPGAMQSLLGVDSLALPVKLTLRIAGKSETKTLVLRPVPPPAATPAAK